MKRKLYPTILVISIMLFVMCMFIPTDAKWVGFVFGISVYLFLNSIINICKTNEKVKNIVMSILDILFWLP